MSSRSRAESLSLAWRGMQDLVEADREASRIGRALGLGEGRGRVGTLLLLTRGPLTLSEIAVARGFDRPYATVIVDQLAGSGYVERTPHPHDGRRKLVRLTAAGERMAATADALVGVPPPVFARLTGAEAAALEGLVRRLGAAGPA